MAVEQPVEAEHSGGPLSRFRATLKRITPGEWALIGVGIVGVVVFVIYYRRQQASSSSYTPAGGTSTPNYGTAVTGDANSQYQGELAQLLYMLENGSWQTPSTSPQSSGGGGGGAGSAGGAAGGVGGIGGGSGGTGGGVSSILNTPASSGSGITQQGNNSSPIGNATQLTQAPPAPAPGPAPLQTNALGLPANTGTVGVPMSAITGNPAASPVRVPPNVTPNLSPAGGSQTVGARVQAPVIRPVNVVQQYTPTTVTHATAPVYSPPPPASHQTRPMR